VNYEIVDLPGVGVHQRRPAMTAAIIDGVRAGDEHGRGADGGPVRGRFNEFEAFALTITHGLAVHRRMDCHRVASHALKMVAGKSRLTGIVAHNFIEPHCDGADRAPGMGRWNGFGFFQGHAGH
jgi:hypothetical protein